MNCFHVPRGFSVTSTIALRWSPLPVLTILTLRLPVDLLPLQPFSSEIILDMSPLHGHSSLVSYLSIVFLCFPYHALLYLFPMH
jgi:hypothetical protein